MKDQNIINDEMFQLIQDLILINGKGWNSEIERLAYDESRNRLYKKAKRMYLQYEMDKLDNE
jgi:hypothetical protein